MVKVWIAVFQLFLFRQVNNNFEREKEKKKKKETIHRHLQSKVECLDR